MSKTEEEYEKHIKSPQDGNKTICGLPASYDWAFESIDHAYRALHIGVKIPVCRVCTAMILRTFRKSEE